MVALTFLYCLVFFYIRYQLKKFSTETSSTDKQISGYELDTQWRSDLEALPNPPPTPSGQILTTRTVTVTTQDRRPSEATVTATGFSLSFRNIHTEHSQLLARKRMLQVARSLLWYPLIYLVVTAPLTIGRLATFANNSWAVMCIFVGAAFYASGGFFNVLLYTSTRKGIVSWSWFGWKKRSRRRKSRPPTNPFSPSPKLDRGGPFIAPEKLGSESSTTTSTSSHLHDVPLSPGADPSIPGRSRPTTRDSNSDIDLAGVDFTHSTGFDVVPGGDADKLFHDRYCVQTRIEEASLPGLGTTACTCKNIPNY